MATRFKFGDHEIVVLESHETVLNQCDEGDVAVVPCDGEFGVVFVGKNMRLDSWAGTYASSQDAIQDIYENS